MSFYNIWRPPYIATGSTDPTPVFCGRYEAPSFEAAVTRYLSTIEEQQHVNYADLTFFGFKHYPTPNEALEND